MCKFFELTETTFELNHLDQSYEFNEFFEYVFQKDNKKTVLFFVFKKGKNKKEHKHLIKHVKEYYVKQRGYNKCKFLTQ